MDVKTEILPEHLNMWRKKVLFRIKIIIIIHFKVNPFNVNRKLLISNKLKSTKFLALRSSLTETVEPYKTNW